jgi:hypothetical protein
MGRQRRRRFHRLGVRWERVCERLLPRPLAQAFHLCEDDGRIAGGVLVAKRVNEFHGEVLQLHHNMDELKQGAVLELFLEEFVVILLLRRGERDEIHDVVA